MRLYTQRALLVLPIALAVFILSRAGLFRERPPATNDATIHGMTRQQAEHILTQWTFPHSQIVEDTGGMCFLRVRGNPRQAWLFYAARVGMPAKAVPWPLPARAAWSAKNSKGSSHIDTDISAGLRRSTFDWTGRDYGVTVELTEAAKKDFTNITTRIHF